MTSRRGILVLFSLVAMSLNQPTPAQSSENGPALGVARLSLAKGDVTVQRGESGDSIQATANMPLVEADILTTGLASRAEVQLDYSNFVRLNEYASVQMANLAYRTFRIQLERGILTYSELRGGDADVDIETPLAAVRPEKNGQYRVEVFGRVRVIVTVRKGRAEVASASGRQTLKSGQRMIVHQGDQNVEFRVTKADPKDDWDLWNLRRDRQLMKSKAYSYVNPSVYGAEDLDNYGHWTVVPNYGRCWFPSVAVGWAPYRYGRWSWMDYYGWTWVSYDPWGWAPYHYGRWFRHARYGWGWYPGPYDSRHYWQPALVAFFGFDGRGGVGIGLGSRYGYYGWIPLAPGDPYYPWYGRRSHRRRGAGSGGSTVLVNNRINIYNNYRNARHRNGTTLVSARDFSRGKILNARSLQASEVRRASLMRGRIPVVPDRVSQGRLIRKAARRIQGPGSTTPTRFYSTGRSPRNITRRSFTQQRRDMVQFVGSLEGRDIQAIRPADSRSSTRSQAIRSAPGSTLNSRGTTGNNSAAGSTNRRSLPSRSNPTAIRGRSAAGQSIRGTVNSPPPTAVRPDGGRPADSLERRRRVSRVPAATGTIPRGTSARTSTRRSAESVSDSSPSVPSVPALRPSPRFVPRNSSRVNTIRRQGSTPRPAVSNPRLSSEGTGRVNSRTTPRFTGPPPVGGRPRTRLSPSNPANSGVRQPSNSRPSVSRSRSRVSSPPSYSRPAPSVSKPSSRTSSRVSTPSRPSPPRTPSRVRSAPSYSRPAPSVSRPSSRSSPKATSSRSSRSSTPNRSNRSRSPSKIRSKKR